MKQATEDRLTSAKELPYFEGDFWPNVLEESIKELEQEEEERKKEESTAASETTEVTPGRALGLGFDSRVLRGACLIRGSVSTQPYRVITHCGARLGHSPTTVPSHGDACPPRWTGGLSLASLGRMGRAETWKDERRASCREPGRDGQRCRRESWSGRSPFALTLT